MTVKYFIVPFASSGDRVAVPDDVDPSGYVSYSQGYTADYESPSGTYPIERDKFNDILYEITLSEQQYQQNGIPNFITSADNDGSPYSYSKYATVLYGGVKYTSLVDSNTDTPPSANWSTGGTVTNVANVYTAQQNFGMVAIYSASNSIAWNLNTAQVASHTLTENTTLANPTNQVAGGTYIIKFIQASSAKTLAFGSAYKWSGSAPTVSTGSGAVDIYTFLSDGTNMYGTYQQNFS